MSTDFTPGRRIFARDLFDGRLAKFGVHEWVTQQEDQTLTDGQGNYLWVFNNDDGSVAFFTRCGWDNDTDAILAAVAEAFETEIFSEHEPQYWGCETNEELARYYLREISLAVSEKAQQRFNESLPPVVSGTSIPNAPQATRKPVRS